MDEQVCSNCNRPKPAEEFFYRDSESGVRHTQCKTCMSQKRRSKEHYQKYKSEYIRRSNERRKRISNENRVNLIEYFKYHPCIVCGETNPVVLDFDHRDRNLKVIAIAKMIAYHRWDKILKEIEKCDVLCANHHRIKTSKQLGWFYETIEQKV